MVNCLVFKVILLSGNQVESTLLGQVNSDETDLAEVNSERVSQQKSTLTDRANQSQL